MFFFLIINHLQSLYYLYCCVRTLTVGVRFLQGLSVKSRTALVSRGICVSLASRLCNKLAATWEGRWFKQQWPCDMAQHLVAKCYVKHCYVVYIFWVGAQTLTSSLDNARGKIWKCKFCSLHKKSCYTIHRAYQTIWSTRCLELIYNAQS